MRRATRPTKNFRSAFNATASLAAAPSYRCTFALIRMHAWPDQKTCTAHTIILLCQLFLTFTAVDAACMPLRPARSAAKGSEYKGSFSLPSYARIPAATLELKLITPTQLVNFLESAMQAAFCTVTQVSLHAVTLLHACQREQVCSQMLNNLIL